MHHINKSAYIQISAERLNTKVRGYASYEVISNPLRRLLKYGCTRLPVEASPIPH